MGKFRSKLKGKSKGKRWLKGQSSNSNPKLQKYRDMAKSRFFQENLGSTGLTQQAVQKHEAMTTYGHASNEQKSDAETELVIAKELENMSMKSGDEGTVSETTSSMRSGTFKSFQTFASHWSQCSNVSYSKMLNRFDPNSAIHKEMLAILAAVTEVIKEQGGKETSTAYFLALMETLKSSEMDNSQLATMTLLAMGIRTVPIPVLRKQFSECAPVFTEVLEKNAQSENGTLLIHAMSSLSVLLRAQEYALWGESSTVRVFESILAFTLHSKPKVRKSAHIGIAVVLRASIFMMYIEGQAKPPRVHPASNRVAEFCLSQIKPEALLAGHRSVLHTLAMLRQILPVFSKDYIKTVCESILSLMTHNNVFIKTCCLHTLHALFSLPLKTNNITAPLAVQLTRALMAARPPANDAGLVLAWAAVMQQGYCCLANLDLNLCISNLPAFVNICVTELWLSDVAEINAASTNALKTVLLDCVKQAVVSEYFAKYKSHVDAIFKCIGTGLDNPFNQAIKHVILTIAVCFQIGDAKIAHSLEPLLRKMNDRRESHHFENHKEVEYATGYAIKSLGPEFVLKAIPLRNEPDSINIERTWLLPVLKEKIQNSNLKYFATEILEMATFCRKKSRELTEEKNAPLAHTYELLCNQFWALLPSFCNNPVDISTSFQSLARVLGSVLKDNPEFRLSVMQALRKLISCTENNINDQNELARFAKNYLPILLNIYMSPAKGSSAEGQRLAALETIQVYLTISDNKLREELFTNAIQQLETSKDNHHQRESILDIIRTLVLYQDSDKIAKLFDDWVYPLCETVLENPKKHKKAKKESLAEENGEKNIFLKYKEKARLLEMEHKKAYRILEEIFKSHNAGCEQFVKDNYKKIKKLLMTSLNKVADSSKAARLRCIEHLINKSPFLNSESKLLKHAIAESVICTKDINSKCRQCAFNVITTVGNVLKNENDGMQAFVSLLTSGLSAPLPRVVSASLRSLAAALYNFSEDMGLQLVQGQLEIVASHMLNSNREIVAAALSFLKVYTKVLPTDVLAGSLPLIFKTLSSMEEDCKRHSRTEIGYFLTRMMRKFGADTIERLISLSDEVMHRRLRNIRKMDNRKKRQKENQTDQSEQDSDGEVIKGSSQTLEDILKDSDSEMEFLEEEEERPKAKKSKKTKSQAWIQDDPENIVDLADVSASRKITATDPSRKKAIEVKAQKKKDGGFKTAPDGRLIITDDAFDNDDEDKEPRPSGDIDTDSDDTDAEDEDTKPSKLLKAGSKRRYDDILSVKSGKSSRSKASTVTVGSKYKAGGKGIHRPLGSSASAASGAGTEFKSKKAKGDVKKKGKHDPYAYLPLSRTNLNKRKKAVNTKQFKGIVKSKIKHQNKRKK